MKAVGKKWLRRFSKHLGFLIEGFENPKIERLGRSPAKHPLVFIVGAPRTGSTFLYEILTNSLDILYADNLVDAFYINWYFGFWLSKKLGKNKAHNCFGSVHGDTSGFGWRAPAECGDFWYRWLPRTRHFIDGGELGKEAVAEIRSNLFSVINRYNKPMLLKNMNAGQRMRLIYEISPDSRFIFLRRNPVDVALSILRVRRAIHGNESTWWSLIPRNYDQISGLQPVPQIVKQIYFLEKQIIEDSTLFKSDNFLTLNYEDVVNSPLKTIDLFQSLVGTSLTHRPDALQPVISPHRHPGQDQELVASIETEVRKLDWDDYSSPA